MYDSKGNILSINTSLQKQNVSEVVVLMDLEKTFWEILSARHVKVVMADTRPCRSDYQSSAVWNTCKSMRLVRGHSSEVSQVTLVAHKHDDDVVVCMVPQLFQPPFHILIGQVFGNIINQEGPNCSSIVTDGDRKWWKTKND